MTLDEACSAFESLFAEIETDPNGALEPTVLCSGAIGRADSPPPVLCATAGLAIELWRRTAYDYATEWVADVYGFTDPTAIDELRQRAKLIWVRTPALLRFKMTMQDDSGGQRVATTRYAVYSLCSIVESTPDVVAEPEPQCLKTTGGNRSRRQNIATKTGPKTAAKTSAP